MCALPAAARSARERLAFALDVSDWPTAEKLATELSGAVGVFKVGLELFCAAGPQAVTSLRARGASVFLDLKLHDIPATMTRAVEVALRHGASFLTLHASAGSEALRAAVELTRGSTLSLLAVSVLTSADDAMLEEIGVRGPARDAVLRLARLALDCGVRGLVCSPNECELLRAEFGQDVFLVTPGIRPSGSAQGDQKRVATPARAIAAGADLLVVGRPIRDAKHPRAAAESVVRDIEQALAAS
ncbi:MAG TPA: orotidine-5'-phosphate decarboxylase [Polyangiales bacterium]|nr:orotidine-5'-phosphate decarboxylase [Polyangiales bacterium]